MPYLPDLPGLTGLSEIGRGGNGVVYRARQEDLSRVVAIKVLAARLDHNAAARFAREGQALGMVSGHPNIVPIYQAGTTANGEPFLVMQFCDGGSLVDLIHRTGPLSLPAVLELGVKMAGALQTAHDAGILHRDIKPANILLDSYDAPMLADFGQARHSDNNLTRTGDVVATPGYAAPEVLSGRPATPQSDVYSLAATLMAALLGRGPFARDSDESVAAILLRVVQEPPPDLRRIGVPDQVARLLEQSMAKDPGPRPPTAAVFGRAIQQAQQQLGLPVTNLALAGRAPTGQLPVVSHGQMQPTSALTPPTAPAAQPTSHLAGVPAAKVKRRWVTWVAAAAVVVVAGAGTVVGFNLLSDPEIRTISDPADLVTQPSDLPGTWTVTDEFPGAYTDFVGQYYDDNDDPIVPSALAECQAMPVAEIKKRASAPAYFEAQITSATPGPDFAPKSYLIERSVGFVMPDAAAAKAMVTPWAGSRYDGCRLDNAKSVGIDVGNEYAFSETPTKYAEPYPDLDVPDNVEVAIREFTVPLSKTADQEEFDDPQKQTGSRVVTLVALSAGTSVSYLVLQTNQDPYDADAMQTIVDNMVAKLVE